MTSVEAWRLDTPSQTLVLAQFGGRMPEVVYWGAPLPASEDLEALARQSRQFPTGGMLDEVAPLSICPQPWTGFHGQPGLVAWWGGDPLRFDTATVTRTEDEEDGTRQHLEVSALSGTGRRAVLLRASVFADEDMLVASASMRHPTDWREGWANDLRIDWWCPLALPAVPASRVVTLGGRWCGEFQRQDLPWPRGRHEEAPPPGRTGHESQPTVFLLGEGASETQGEVCALHLRWSGGHRLIAETLPDGRRQVQLGAAATRGPRKGQMVEAPGLLLTRSGAGLNGASHPFHARIRRSHQALFPRERPRPVHYNCWEAVYFDHDPEVVFDLARRAAALGVERFVLDDGWFGARDSDRRGLGDWRVDRRKWPDGLAPLIAHVRSLGMGFGLWVEPEMANEDSDFGRAHPDWLMGLDQPQGRHQRVIDLTIPAAWDHVHGRLSTLLAEHEIEYLKWDHNRILPAGAPDQTGAVDRLMESLLADNPGLEIETCASGGGRIDLAMLELTTRAWTSDSNDAKARWGIQRGASYLYPPEVLGAHVGPRVCHTSGRTFPIAYRAAVAMTRSFGLEMDLRELTEDEAAHLRKAIQLYKQYRPLMHTGRLHRLDSDDPAVSAEMHVATWEYRMGRDRPAAFILFAAQLEPSAQPLSRPLRLAGLDPAKRYRCGAIDGTMPEVLNRGGHPLAEPVTLSGAALMQRGLTLPQMFPDTVAIIVGFEA